MLSCSSGSPFNVACYPPTEFTYQSDISLQILKSGAGVFPIFWTWSTSNLLKHFNFLNLPYAQINILCTPDLVGFNWPFGEADHAVLRKICIHCNDHIFVWQSRAIQAEGPVRWVQAAKSLHHSWSRTRGYPASASAAWRPENSLGWKMMKALIAMLCFNKKQLEKTYILKSYWKDIRKETAKLINPNW